MLGKKSRGTLVSALFSLLILRYMYSNFRGLVVARLPFEPLSIFANLTHNGLEGDDLRDCSMTLVYVLANLTIGNYTKKLLGLEGQRVTLPQTSGNPWG